MKVALACAVALAVLGGAFYFYSTHTEVALLQNNLSGYLVPPVTDVTGTAALRVQYASVLARLNPIFGMEGTDPDQLASSVQDLQAKLNSILPIYDSADAAILKQLFYPVDMLNSAATTERARQTLIAQPSLANAQAYYQSLSDTIQKDIAFSQNLETTLKINPAFQTTEQFGFFGGYTTSAKYAEAMAEYITALNTDAQEVAVRSGCLKKFSSACPSLSGALAQLTTAGTIVPQPTDITGDVTDNQKIVQAYLNGGSLSQSTSTSFLVGIPASVCFPNRATAYYIIWTQPDQNGNTIFNPAFDSDIYFYDTKTFQDIRVTPTLRAQVPYLYQPAANPYMCANSGDDLTQLMTVSTVRATLAQAPLFAGTSDPAGALEEQIVTSQTLNEDVVTAYLNDLRTMLQNKGEAGLVQSLGENKTLEIERLLEIAAERSANFDEIVRDAVSHENSVGFFASKNAPIPFWVVMLARSYYPFLLLSYNQSVTPSSLDITVPQNFDISEFKLVSYDDYLKLLYTPQQTLSMMRLGHKLEYAAN